MMEKNLAKGFLDQTLAGGSIGIASYSMENASNFLEYVKANILRRYGYLTCSNFYDPKLMEEDGTIISQGLVFARFFVLAKEDQEGELDFSGSPMYRKGLTIPRSKNNALYKAFSKSLKDGNNKISTVIPVDMITSLVDPNGKYQPNMVLQYDSNVHQCLASLQLGAKRSIEEHSSFVNNNIVNGAMKTNIKASMNTNDSQIFEVVYVGFVHDLFIDKNKQKVQGEYRFKNDEINYETGYGLVQGIITPFGAMGLKAITPVAEEHKNKFLAAQARYARENMNFEDCFEDDDLDEADQVAEEIIAEKEEEENSQASDQAEEEASHPQSNSKEEEAPESQTNNEEISNEEMTNTLPKVANSLESEEEDIENVGVIDMFFQEVAGDKVEDYASCILSESEFTLLKVYLTYKAGKMKRKALKGPLSKAENGLIELTSLTKNSINKFITALQSEDETSKGHRENAKDAILQFLIPLQEGTVIKRVQEIVNNGKEISAPEESKASATAPAPEETSSTCPEAQKPGINGGAGSNLLNSLKQKQNAVQDDDDPVVQNDGDPLEEATSSSSDNSSAETTDNSSDEEPETISDENLDDMIDEALGD